MFTSKNKQCGPPVAPATGKKGILCFISRLFPILILFVCLTVLMPATALAAAGAFSSGDLSITRDPATGAVSFLSSRQGLDSGVTRKELEIDPAAAVRKFLVGLEEVLGMPRLLEELSFKQKSVDDIGMIHVHLRQIYEGVPVFGAELIVHYAADGTTVRALNGRFIPRLAVDPAPRINRRDAIAAVRAIQPLGGLWEQPMLRIYSSQVDRNIKGNHLAWLVRIYDEATPSRNLYVVDAHSAEILTSYNELDTARSRFIYDAENGTSLPGTLVRGEGQGPVDDEDADNAYDFLGDTYDYYWDKFGRDSYDGAGADLIATVHYLTNYPNAFWNGEQMVFGDGFVVDDVTAHEMTHAVTQSEADLIYQDQSGALNETFSDVFGEFVDQLNFPPDPPFQDWLMGEDLPVGAIRDMSDPPAYGDPDKVSDYDCTRSDNGGVHTNSGIANKAAYLIAAGDSFNGYNVLGIGLAKTGLVHYLTLTEYLFPSAGFVDYYNAMNQACTELIGTEGITAEDCVQVDRALLATELNTEPECDGWVTVYDRLLESESDLALLRRYRDEILMSLDSGILYTRLLYDSSEEALDVLNQNPELMSRAAGLITANLGAVAEALAGNRATIPQSDEIIAFLNDFTMKSSGPLKLLARKVRREMKKCKAAGKTFLGFNLQ